jgi:hypothetical protein
MFELIDKHLKVARPKGALPAGIIISGGGAGQGSISDIAKGTLNLPSRIADMRLTSESEDTRRDLGRRLRPRALGPHGRHRTPKKQRFSGIGGSSPSSSSNSCRKRRNEIAHLSVNICVMLCPGIMKLTIKGKFGG